VSSVGGAASYSGDRVEHGARSPMIGVVVGVDANMGESAMLGVSGGESNPDLQVSGADDKAQTRMLQFGVYGRVKKHRSYLDGAINFGTQRNRVSRMVTDGRFASTASSTYEGRTISSRLDYGYSFDVGKGFVIAPQVSAQYGRLVLDGTTETGAALLSLIVPGRQVISARSLTGVRIAKSFDGRGSAFTIEGRTSWSHEFDAIGDIQLRFVGDAWTDGFNLAAPRQLRDSALTGGTLSGGLTRSLRVFATVDGEMSGAFTSWSGNIGLVKSW
jgi:uncharacterized protein with beta-barrel porin domain